MMEGQGVPSSASSKKCLYLSVRMRSFRFSAFSGCYSLKCLWISLLVKVDQFSHLEKTLG